MPVRVQALDHLVINVADVAVTTEWYRKILGMEVKVFDPGGGKAPRTSPQFGQQKINVRPRDADKVEWFTAGHQTAGSEDLCFLTSSTPSSQGLLAMTEEGARRPSMICAPRPEMAGRRNHQKGSRQQDAGCWRRWRRRNCGGWWASGRRIRTTPAPPA